MFWDFGTFIIFQRWRNDASKIKDFINSDEKSSTAVFTTDSRVIFQNSTERSLARIIVEILSCEAISIRVYQNWNSFTNSRYFRSFVPWCDKAFGRIIIIKVPETDWLNKRIEVNAFPIERQQQEVCINAFSYRVLIRMNKNVCGDKLVSSILVWVVQVKSTKSCENLWW